MPSYNSSEEDVKNAAPKGGQSSHAGGFASIDADKQKEIASMGGKASGGSFEPISQKASEAGRKEAPNEDSFRGIF